MRQLLKEVCFSTRKQFTHFNIKFHPRILSSLREVCLEYCDLGNKTLPKVKQY